MEAWGTMVTLGNYVDQVVLKPLFSIGHISTEINQHLLKVLPSIKRK